MGAPASTAARWPRSHLGERGLTNRDQQLMPHLSGKYVILVLEPGKLGLQVAYSLLQAAHL